MSATAEKVGRICSIVFAAFNAVTFCFCTIGFLRIRVHFATVFRDLFQDIALPQATAFLLNVPTLVVLVVTVILFALLVAKEWLRPVWIPLTLNSLWLALGSVLWVLFILAMMMPMLSLVSALK